VFVESLLCALPAPFVHRSVIATWTVTRIIVTALLLSTWSQQQHLLVSWRWGTIVIHWLSFFCIFASFAQADSPTQVVLCLLVCLLIGGFSTWLVRHLANLIFWTICHMACLRTVDWTIWLCLLLCCIEKNYNRFTHNLCVHSHFVVAKGMFSSGNSMLYFICEICKLSCSIHHPSSPESYQIYCCCVQYIA